MSSQRITIRVPKELGARLRDRSRAKGKTPSDLTRAALEAYLGREGDFISAYDIAKREGLIGSVRGAPKDLSTNRRHLKRFGA